MANRLLLRLLIIAACVSAWAELAWAERKVAIVIGNSSYEHSQPLKNPVNDTKAVSDLFKQLGYEVQLHLDVDRVELTKALGDFHQIATSADAAIFYYAGHGVSVDGRNYLIPVDSNIQRVTDVKLGAAIDAELAIEQALSDAKVKLVFLDACRDNPFVEQIKRSLGTTRSTAVSSGLAEMKSGAGTLIAFSTAPGQVALDGDGDKSPFAEALLKHLSEPGLEVRLAMTKVRADVEAVTSGKQTPWESTNLTGFYYLTEPPEKISTLVPQENSETASESEMEFWRSVKESNDEVLLRSYIEKFPGGLYRPIADRLLKRLAVTKKESSATGQKKETPELLKTSSENETSATETKSNSFGLQSEQIIIPSDKAKKSTKLNPAQNPKITPPIKTPKDKKDLDVRNNKLTSLETDQSAYLSKRVRKPSMGSRIWEFPAGVMPIRKEERFIVFIYKGRKYSCTKVTDNIGGAYCALK